MTVRKLPKEDVVAEIRGIIFIPHLHTLPIAGGKI